MRDRLGRSLCVWVGESKVLTGKYLMRAEGLEDEPEESELVFLRCPDAGCEEGFPWAYCVKVVVSTVN